MLARRSIVNTWRQPGAWAPSVVFPLMLAAVYAAQFSKATALPGFPEVDSFLQFILPASVLQGVAFNSGEAGSAMATDIENGFFDRLVTSPSSRISLFVGRLAGAAVFSAGLAAVLIAAFAAFGAPVKGGLLAGAALVVIASGLSLAIGGITLIVALRTGSPEAAQSMFPLTFVAIFVSSAFFPTELMSGWYQSVAEVNPITLIINPTRRMVISGFAADDFLAAMGWISVLAVGSLGFAYRAYLGRVRRG